MTPRALKLLAIALAVLFVGCRTTSTSNIKSIQIPPNLSQRDAKFAVIASVAHDTDPDGWKNWEKLTDAALAAHFGMAYATPYQSRGAWYVEGVEPQAVILGYAQGSYYLRVRMRIDEGWVVPVVEDSNNLKQSGDRIHKGAIEWINRLEVMVRASLGRRSSYKASTAEVQSTENK